MTSGPYERCNVAIFGFGAVGRAIASLLAQRGDRYASLYGKDVRLVGVRRSRVQAFDRNGIENSSLEGAAAWRPVTDGFFEASGADVLIEAGPSDLQTGGAGLPAIEGMLERGSAVIAVSKGALVFKGPALRDLAAKTGAVLKMSGAAGAALPALDLLQHSLSGCGILRVEGILNATSNHLLCAMMARNLSFEEALDEARAAGTMDSDPRFDVEGWDTAAKIVILANFGLDAELTIDDVTVAGIQGVTAARVRDWRARGLVPKLIGSIRREDQGIVADVTLRELPSSDPMAVVDGSNKAVRIVSDAMGEVFVSACGPEPLATAAAALKDLEEIFKAAR